MRWFFGVAAAAALLFGVTHASAQSSVFDFEDGTDQGWGTGFGNDASANYPIELVGGSNRMRVLRTAFQSAGRESGNVAEAFYQAMQAAATNEANYLLSYDYYIDTSAGGYADFLQLGTFVNTGDGYYAQDFPNMGKDLELDGAQVASGQVFSGTITESFAAKGFNMDPANTFYRLGLIINGGGTAIVVHFDNIRIFAIPEPASLAALACVIPALTLMRRRRTR